MSDKDLPAFPTEVRVLDAENNQEYVILEGMRLRDYFAAKAMQGFLADPNAKCSFSLFAKDSYLMADAMLEARK